MHLQTILYKQIIIKSEREGEKVEKLANALSAIDTFVWGPVMLVLLVGTGIYLTIRLRFITWRNLGYALKSTLSKEARKKTRGTGDVSPFSALTTALAATIGTGNIVGVATAMVSGGPGALVWMLISACFDLTTKFSECMLAIKYREVNEKGEMSGGPMYTMKRGFKHKKVGAVLGWLFALFAVIASFGIGNLTQANSISTSFQTTFHVPLWITGIVITVLALVIIIGGIQTISKVSSVVVPLMAIFYIIAGIIVILGNFSNVPEGICLIVKMAFSPKAVSGGVLGTVVASMMGAMRYGVARGCFSNEAGMGSAAITAAAATTDHPVRQGYINMTGTFWDTIVVCTITGLCIASSGVLGSNYTAVEGNYSLNGSQAVVSYMDGKQNTTLNMELNGTTLTYADEKGTEHELTAYFENTDTNMETMVGEWKDSSGSIYVFDADGSFERKDLYEGSALTIEAFKTVLGPAGGWLICIGIALFAFSTILGWEYHGEKAFEYLLGTHKYNMIYRIIFSLIAYVGSTTALDIVWNFSDIANALMAIPNLICLLALSGVIVKEVNEFQEILKKEKAEKVHNK